MKIVQLISVLVLLGTTALHAMGGMELPQDHGAAEHPRVSAAPAVVPVEDQNHGAGEVGAPVAGDGGGLDVDAQGAVPRDGAGGAGSVRSAYNDPSFILSRMYSVDAAIFGGDR